MLGFNRARRQPRAAIAPRPNRVAIEALENRRLLHGFGGGFGDGSGEGFGGRGHLANTIEFSQAPTAVQTGLDTLASKDSLPAPTATQTVYLGNSRGVETYSIRETGTGTVTTLTVDPSGNPVTAPTNTTTTFGAISSTAVTGEISAIATALGLTAPTATTNVRVTTPSGGTAVYTVLLSRSSGNGLYGRAVSVDANGNPVGNQNLPFSVIPTAIQTGLNTNRPSGATALATNSTQTVNVRTANGLTTYSTTFTSSGTTTTVTVDTIGKLAKLPSHSTAQFQSIPAAAQKELQTLATGDGVIGTISTTQSVNVYDEANGTTIYSVTLPASKTSSGGHSYTVNITIATDENGNPTTPPRRGDEGVFGDRFGGFAGSEFGGFGFFGRRHG